MESQQLPSERVSPDGDTSGETVALPVIHCLRCGARYVARTTALPKTCAKCKSHHWNIPIPEEVHVSCPHCDWTRTCETRVRPGRRGSAEERAVKALQLHVKRVHGIDALLKLKFGSEEVDDGEEIENDAR